MPRSERGGQEVGSQEGVTKDGKEQTQDEGGKGASDQKESSEPKLSERYRDEDADVTIVSSDGVTFKVHSHFLKSSSPTFRSMLSLAKVPSQRDPIVFTDQTIEHSMVLERLLDIIIDCEMTPTEDIRLIKYVIHLAQKWDFTNALKVMRTDIRLAICDDSGRYLDDCLLHWGTELKDYECLSWLIRYGGDGTWCDYFGPQKSDSITSGNSTDGAGLLSHSKNGGGLEGAHLFEPGSMGVEGYLDLPPLVHWAIARATLLAEKETGKRKQWKLIGEKFKSLMEEAFPPSNSDKKRKAKGDVGDDKETKASRIG